MYLIYCNGFFAFGVLNPSSVIEFSCSDVWCSDALLFIWLAIRRCLLRQEWIIRFVMCLNLSVTSACVAYFWFHLTKFGPFSTSYKFISCGQNVGFFKIGWKVTCINVRHTCTFFLIAAQLKWTENEEKGNRATQSFFKHDFHYLQRNCRWLFGRQWFSKPPKLSPKT